MPTENVSLNTDGVLLDERRYLELCEAERKLSALPVKLEQAMQEVQRSTCDEAQTGAVLMYWASITWPKWSTEIVLRELGLPAPKEGK